MARDPRIDPASVTQADSVIMTVIDNYAIQNPFQAESKPF